MTKCCKNSWAAQANAELIYLNPLGAQMAQASLVLQHFGRFYIVIYPSFRVH